jgi:hypothetical protein
MEITHRNNAGRKNTKANNEIPAKRIQAHWPTQEKMAGNVRPEQALPNPRRRKKRIFLFVGSIS